MNLTKSNDLSKGKILALSDSPTTCTGFATICSNIMTGMVEKNWEVNYMGHNYLGQDLVPPITFEDGRTLNFKLQGAGREQYCKDMIVPRINKFNPDVFFIQLDTFMVFPWFMDLPLNRTRSVFYFPSDGAGGMPLGCENILKKVNMPVAMAKFGQKQVKDLYNIDSEYIPHAIDEKNYFPLPLEEREKLKAKYGLTGRFVVGTVARNQGRKMMDLTFKAFAIFCKDKPDAVLFLHTDPQDAAAVFNMQELARRYNIANRVMFSGMTFFNGFSYKQMNEVYNVMDIFTLSTSGEGFGVPTIEAQACGIPVVIPNNTTGPELVLDDGKSGLLADSAASITGSWSVERDIPDINSLADCYSTLYHDKKKREAFGKVGRRKILESYTWENVNNQWDKLFTKLKI
tara:strand:+ start:7967 stop:9169 length:1203 start_codon:yes stop_codon:yes gene_type:complete